MQAEYIQDVIVIGSGVVGAFAALNAIKHQLKVTVLERNVDVTLGTTNSNSGIVHAGYNTAPGTLKAKFVDLGNKIIDDLAGPLNFTYNRCGALVVARAEEDNAAIDKMVAYSKEQGIPVEIWDEEKLRKEEPHLSPNIKRALHAPTAGVVIPYELTLAAMQTCTASGVDLRLDREVRAIKKVGEYYEVHAYDLVKFHEEIYKTKVVINAAGLYADKIAAMVDPETPIKIKPRRGEEYLCKKDAWSLVKHIIFPVPNKVSKGTLVIPSADGRLMIGPTADEVDDPNNRDTTASGYKRIMEAVQSMVPSIGPQLIVANFAGVRAADINGDFVINEKDGFINLAGMQSPALTAAPAIGEFVVSEYLSKHFELKPNGNFKLVPFKTRFHRANLALKNDYVKKDANYAKIVCMCEMVTEADIHNAITEGARTLDGIKFRTRMGMGDCQGGFCTTKAIQLLSERLGVEQNQITKRGRGTEMIANSHSTVGGNDAVSEYKPEVSTKPMFQTKDETNAMKLVDESYADIIIIGAGPAGLGAGLQARKEDATKSVLLLDRSNISGGILRQCIHCGFGLKRYKKELTGPEYAEMLADEAVDAGCHILLQCVVLGTERNEKDKTFTISCIIAGVGLKKFTCRSVITAAGCRERTRPEVRIAGPRPSGVYTAGLAQMMINIRGQVPKGRVVILGSGDIGLIMARRCTLEGMKVLGVYELLPLCSGLRRNVIQCLEDFNIPLHLSKTVVEVIGRDRLEAVKIAKVDPKTLIPDLAQTETIECEYLILSVGLIQQVKLVVQTGGVVDPRSRGCKVDGRCEVKDGAFAVGNCLTVHDLADDAVQEGTLAGRAAIARLSDKGEELEKQMEYAPVEASDQVVFIVPQQICVGPAAPLRQHLAMRVRKPMGSIILKAFYGEDEIGMTKVNEAVPAEMIHITLAHTKLHNAWEKAKGQKITVQITQNTVEIEEAPGMQNATCTICPNSCTVWGRVNDEGKVVDIHGNSCPRGARYIQDELTAPVRTISMAVALEGSKFWNRISVKPDRHVPKDRVLELAEYCRGMKVKVGVRMGQCVAEKVLGGLCNIISCSTVLE